MKEKKKTKMTEEEEIQFVDWIEMKLDFGENKDISKEDMELYKYIILKRKNHI